MTTTIATTHTTPRSLGRLAAVLGFLIAAQLAPSARALTLGESFLQVGIGMGKVDGAAHDADMTTYTALYNHKIRDGLVALDARGSYEYGDITDSLGGTIQDTDVDLYLSFPKIPIVKPFVIAGVSYDKFNLHHNFGPEYGWDFGYNLGVGAEVHVLPALPITASIRYTHGDIERITYTLDATFWFTKFGIGANIMYEDGHGGFDNNVTQGNLYFALRF